MNDNPKPTLPGEAEAVAAAAAAGARVDQNQEAFDPTKFMLLDTTNYARPAPPIKLTDEGEMVLLFMRRRGGAMYGDPVKAIMAGTGLPQTTVSLALAELNRAGYVKCEYQK